MKIAIHHTNSGFTERWIEYCKQNNIFYKLVDSYDNNINKQLSDCDAFMWHFHQANYKDVLFAKQLLYSLEISGKSVFPNFNTMWHFDDKVGQKYLLEAIDVPLVPSYVFYSKNDALSWAKKTEFPKVFKLRGGAGSANVKLVKTQSQAIKLISKSFGRGFSQFDRIGYLKDRYNKFKAGRDTFVGVLKAIARQFIPTEFARMHHREKGYVYFQDFIPHNDFDIRIIVIGDKAFAIKRMCRENDFRASGSGNIIYNKEEIDIRCVKIAFEVNAVLKSQSLALDFVFDEKGDPLIIELSYGFVSEVYDPCPGYWTNDLKWYEGKFKSEYWMIDNLISSIRNV